MKWPESDNDCSNFWLFGGTQKARSAMLCYGEMRYGTADADPVVGQR
jgi:hypothetical protein